MRTVSFSVYCGWEFGGIGLDRSEKENNNETIILSDLTLEEAKKLVSDLQLAISQYEEMDEMAKEYFEKERLKDVDES